jgi:hypothetical protein
MTWCLKNEAVLRSHKVCSSHNVKDRPSHLTRSKIIPLLRVYVNVYREHELFIIMYAHDKNKQDFFFQTLTEFKDSASKYLQCVDKTLHFDCYSLLLIFIFVSSLLEFRWVSFRSMRSVTLYSRMLLKLESSS